MFIVVENHKPCPKCGEPQPMWGSFDTFWKRFKVFTLLLVLVLVLSASFVRMRSALRYHPRYHGYYMRYYKNRGCGSIF